MVRSGEKNSKNIPINFKRNETKRIRNFKLNIDWVTKIRFLFGKRIISFYLGIKTVLWTSVKRLPQMSEACGFLTWRNGPLSQFSSSIIQTKNKPLRLTHPMLRHTFVKIGNLGVPHSCEFAADSYEPSYICKILHDKFLFNCWGHDIAWHRRRVHLPDAIISWFNFAFFDILSMNDTAKQIHSTLKLQLDRWPWFLTKIENGGNSRFTNLSNLGNVYKIMLMSGYNHLGWEFPYQWRNLYKFCPTNDSL